MIGCSDEPTRPIVTLGQVSPVTISFAPVVLAQELGYFRDEGMEVEIKEFDGSGVLLPQLAAKRVTIGFPNPDAVIMSLQPGRQPLPLTFFYNMARRSVWEFAVLEKSPIRTVEDLRGKKIGVGSLGWAPLVFTRAMFADMGMEVGRDLEFVPVGVGAAAFHALQNGDVDALNLFDTEHATLQASGTAIRRFALREPYASLISNGFITHNDVVRTQRKLLEGFGRAVAKGTVACRANLPGCVRMFWRRYPTQEPSRGTMAEKIAYTLPILESRYGKYVDFAPGEPHNFGAYPANAFSDFSSALHRGGQIVSADLPVDRVFTNSLVGAFNRFDTSAVAQQGRAIK